MGAKCSGKRSSCFARLDDLEQLLAAAGSLSTGRLALGADGPFAVMDLLAAFLRRYPGVRPVHHAARQCHARARGSARGALSDVAVLNLIEHGEDLVSRPAAA